MAKEAMMATIREAIDGMLFPPRESLGHCALNLSGRGRVSAVEEARCMAHRHGRATLGVETTGWRHPSDVWSRD
jgi:hypothetical protein